MRVVAIGLACLSTGAVAAEVRVPTTFGLSLDDGCAVRLDRGDLRLDLFDLVAPAGLRPDGSTVFRVRVPFQSGRRFEVRSRSGRVFRVVVLGLNDGVLAVDLRSIDGSALAVARAPGAERVAASYRRGDADIGGSVASAAFPALTLLDDGTYRLGATSGTWELRAGRLWLSGYYAVWGGAEVDSDGLHFRFAWGSTPIRVHYLRDTVGKDAVSMELGRPGLR